MLIHELECQHFMIILQIFHMALYLRNKTKIFHHIDLILLHKIMDNALQV